MATSADNTAPAEASQALFCAIADHLGKTQYLSVVKQIQMMSKKDRTYDNFRSLVSEKDIEEAFDKKTDTYKKQNNKFKLDELETFLNKEQDWFISSLIIAAKIIVFINKVSNKFNISTQDLFYERGDKEIMGNISKLFDLANQGQKVPKTKSKDPNARAPIVKTPVFGDINKWCPADIYFSTKESTNVIENNLKTYEPAGSPELNFIELNKIMSDLIKNGDLLPLSLKKTTTSVHLVFVNFRRSREEEAINSIKFVSASKWTPYKKADYKKLLAIPAPKLNRSTKKYEIDPKDLQLIKSLETRDIKLNFSEKSGAAEIKIRHDPSGSGSIKAEYKGKNAEARGGSVVSLDILCYLFSLADKKMADEFKKAWISGTNKFREEVKVLGPNPGKGTTQKDTVIKDLYNKKRGGVSAFYVTNEALPIIQAWVEKNSKRKLPGSQDTRADLLIRRIFEYVTSRTEESSKFVIAK